MSDQAQAVVDEQPELENEPVQLDIEDTEAEPTDEPTETDQEETEGGDPEYAEVEIDGVTYQVPAELKDGYMMQADYTQKTQSVAEQRKEAEQIAEQAKVQRQQLEQSTQAVQQNLQQYAVLSNLDSQLNEYANVDWNALNAQDPDAARNHQFHYMQLKEQRDRAYNDIQARERQALQQQQTHIAKRLEESRSVLSREIEGFTPELERQLIDHAVKSGAAQQVATNIIADPVATKLLHKAYMYDQLQAKAAQTRKPPKSNVKPIKTVKGKSPGRKTLADAKSTEEFIAMRNKQLAKK